jgi:UDP-N-acetylmuramate dehydrogenase
LLDSVRFIEQPDGRIRAEAGAGIGMGRLCEMALARGLGGLETFYGMPGSLGGSIYMNARCYDVELADRLESLRWLDGSGNQRHGGIDRDAWSYKRSPFQPGEIEAGAVILGGTFALHPVGRASILATMLEKRGDREVKGHYRLPSAGSVFKNDRRFGRSTGRILDDLGFRGRRIGDALVSDWHANIFVNAGSARAADMLALIESARNEARRVLGIALEPEILFVGEN